MVDATKPRPTKRAVIKRKVDEGISISGPCVVRVARNRDGYLTLAVYFDAPTEVRRVDDCGDVEAGKVEVVG